MNQKDFQMINSQLYDQVEVDNIDNLTMIEVKWLNILRKLPTQKLHNLKNQLTIHQKLLREIQQYQRELKEEKH